MEWMDRWMDDDGDDYSAGRGTASGYGYLAKCMYNSVVDDYDVVAGAVVVGIIIIVVDDDHDDDEDDDDNDDDDDDDDDDEDDRQSTCNHNQPYRHTHTIPHISTGNKLYITTKTTRIHFTYTHEYVRTYQRKVGA
uniref:Uncharacterized protein n=1 Tax=Glossina pallidipes TaxID=7398 RepID=A0A1B0A3F8_GLOPL